MEIYQPAEDSYLLNKYVKEHSIGRVLDMGTGSGIQALKAAEGKNVKGVVAVDINKKAVAELKKFGNRKINTFVSDLFSKIDGKFDLIIFNPPYLPQDKGIDEPALYGGKKGWEISEKFFENVSKHLMPNGKILFLFSSLTNQKKIDEIISNNLFEFKLLGKQKLELFEELYVYLVEKSKLLRKLESKHVENVKYFNHGKRGDIFIGTLDKKHYIKSHFAKSEKIKVAIKIERKESKAIERITNEIRWLKVLNKRGIGPKLLVYGSDYFVYEFVSGVEIKNYVGKDLNKILVNVLGQCYLMDQLGVDKEEMHHPLKHIIIDKLGIPVMIDFERCHKTDKPKNVTQFVEFVCRMKDKSFDVDSLRKLAGEYKMRYDPKILEKLIKTIS
jgi:release factor glutamine methyltransferase